jgi:hypothetical protein
VPIRRPRLKVSRVAVLVASGMVLLGILFMFSFLAAGGYPDISCLATPPRAYPSLNPPRYMNIHQGQVFIRTPTPIALDYVPVSSWYFMLPIPLQTHTPIRSNSLPEHIETFETMTSFDTTDSPSTVQQWYLCVLGREGWRNGRTEDLADGGLKLSLHRLSDAGSGQAKIRIEIRRVGNGLTHVDITTYVL